MQKIRPSESAIEQCTLQLARYVYLEPKFPIFWIILEDLSQKMEGQPPKKEVSGVLGIHIIHYILHHGVRISFNLASKTPARSVMKEKDEGVPTDVSVCVCVHIQYLQIHSAKELLPFQVILLLIPSSLELLAPCHQNISRT